MRRTRKLATIGAVIGGAVAFIGIQTAVAGAFIGNYWVIAAGAILLVMGLAVGIPCLMVRAATEWEDRP